MVEMRRSECSILSGQYSNCGGTAAATMRLALFDLDNTLLSGDSDVLWCDFLIDQGLLEASFRERSEEMAARYAAGTVIPREYYDFYAGTLAGYDPSDLRPLRERFLCEVVRPRIPEDARALLQRHRDAGETLVLTTATNRVISGLTATDLCVDHYICTELEQVDGRFTGRTSGVLNMRAGKIDRLRQWLSELGQPDRLLKEASFYSDSINDLALLSVVRRPVVVDPDTRLESTALRKGWTVLRLNRSR
jgi:HAD superfamily hydrolase (TIGR01490 family)